MRGLRADSLRADARASAGAKQSTKRSCQRSRWGRKGSSNAPRPSRPWVQAFERGPKEMALVKEELPHREAVDVSGWHPNLQALDRYWRSIRQPQGLPSHRDIDPTAIPALLPRIWILDV